MAPDQNEDIPLSQHDNTKAQGNDKIIAPDATKDTTEYPRGLKLVTIMLCLFAAAFLNILDGNIISVAIPRITDEFHSLDDVGWYGSAYFLTRCCITLLAGKIYTVFNIKGVFLACIAIFEIGSAICGAAPSSTALIIGRAIAGFGSAGLMSGVMIVMVHTVPLQRRPMYQAMFGGVFAISSVVGPLLGGALTDGASWRWCFYINLPIGGATILGLIFFLHVPIPPHAADLKLREKLERLDPIGSILILPAITCLLLAVEWGGTTYPWKDGRIIALLVLFGVLTIAFIIVQVWKGEKATVPPRIMKQRTVASAWFYNLCIGAAMMVATYYIPLWFQGIKNVSPVGSGIRLIPFVLSVVAGTTLGALLTSKTGYYAPQLIATPIIASIGAGLITTWQVDTGHAKWIGYQVLFGFGLGIGMMQPNMAMQTVLSKKDIPIGTSLLFFGQPLGGSVFLAVTQNIFNNELSHSLRNIQGLDQAAVASAGATQLRQLVPANMLNEVLQDYNDSLMKSMYVAVAVAAVSIFGAVTIELEVNQERRRSSRERSGKKGRGAIRGLRGFAEYYFVEQLYF